jgi:hypothetical protein
VMIKANTLVMSGAFCKGDVLSEYGPVPSAFLPIGMTPIYSLQLQKFRSVSDRYIITLPHNYALTNHDASILLQNHVEVLTVSPDDTVNEAILAALKKAKLTGPVRIIFGDTLVEGFSEISDSIVISSSIDYYDWTGAIINEAGKIVFKNSVGDDSLRETIIVGHFVFSSPTLIADAIEQTDTIADALNLYNAKITLNLIRAKTWLDVGHMSRLTKSRQKYLVSRAFNSISTHSKILTKRSSDKFKLQSELEWFQALPENLQQFTPKLISDRVRNSGSDEYPYSYSTEYLHLPTLAELAIFGRLPCYRWRHLIERCLDFIRLAKIEFERSKDDLVKEIRTEEIFENLFSKKTQSRISRFILQRGWSKNQTFWLDGKQVPSLFDISEYFINMIEPTKNSHLTILHGDFFFSNILYDSRADQIKVIDPRGHYNPNLSSIVGDWRYDVAKLGHSIYGRYDHIVSGFQYFETDSEFMFRSKTNIFDPIYESYLLHSINGKSVLDFEIKSIIGLLFLSMLPLHDEDCARQNQILANCFRIFRECQDQTC